MAKVIEGNLPPRAKRGCQYPWKEWCDGQQWELTRGEDFVVSITNFRNMAYPAAANIGKSLSIAVIDDNTIRLQARDKT